MEADAEQTLHNFYRKHNIALSKLLGKMGQPVPDWLEEELGDLNRWPQLDPAQGVNSTQGVRPVVTFWYQGLYSHGGSNTALSKCAVSRL